MSHKIFVSYRREDASAEALSIGQFLEREFGSGSVFMDIDIHAGANFPTVLDRQLAESKVLLAIIGPGWLDAKDKEGRRRLDQPEDWVRLEISRALARQIIVIPICVNHAELPDRTALPEDLHGLVDHQAAFVTTSRFRSDMAGLVRDIRTTTGSLRSRVVGVLILALGVILAVGVVWIRPWSSSPHRTEPTVTALASQPPTKTLTADANRPPNGPVVGTAGKQEAMLTPRNQPVSSGNENGGGSGHPKNVPMKGQVDFRSDQGDYIGAGKSWSVGNKDGLFTAIVNKNTVSISYQGDDLWSFDFVAPQGQRLAPGSYLDARRAPFNSPVKPGLSVSGAGRGCNTLTGQFSVRQIEYSDSGSKLKRLLVDFEQHCEEGTPALYGTVDLTAAAQVAAD